MISFCAQPDEAPPGPFTYTTPVFVTVTLCHRAISVVKARAWIVSFAAHSSRHSSNLFISLKDQSDLYQHRYLIQL